MATGTDDITTWAWITFAVLFLLFFSLDLFLHRGGRRRSATSAYLWSVVWIAIGLAFNIFVWFYLGADSAKEYLAAYLIEKSLSLDNLFVFLIIFQSLNIPQRYQHDVLLWGIIGALFFRAIFVFLGAAALARYEWIAQLFGALLILAAYHAFRKNPAEEKENKAVSWLSKHLPITQEIHGQRFVVRENRQHVATPLLIAVLGLEITDVMFAIDSVPAAFSVSRDPFIIYSSNVFAILGLRALYLALIHIIFDLKYLHYGLAGVLAFSGVKLILTDWIHIPALVSVSVTISLLLIAIIASIYNPITIGKKVKNHLGHFVYHYAQRRPMAGVAILIVIFATSPVVYHLLQSEPDEGSSLGNKEENPTSRPKNPDAHNAGSTSRPNSDPPRSIDDRSEELSGKRIHDRDKAEKVSRSSSRKGRAPETIAATNTIIIVQRGDTLFGIAERVYGDPSRWRQIYRVNQRKIKDPDAITIGTRLTIPPKDKKATDGGE